MADMYIFKPLPDADERAPAWQRCRVPNNTDKLAEKLVTRGWTGTIPAGETVYDADGTMIQSGASKPAASKKEA